MTRRTLTEPVADAKYHDKLFSYVRGYLTLEEVLELAAGKHPMTSETGIEALEHWVLEGIYQSIQMTMKPKSRSEELVRLISDLPPRLRERAFWGEVESLQSGFASNDDRLWAEIRLYEEGEALFSVDFTDEILEVLDHCEETESKIDMLESRGAIDGIEWHRRAHSLRSNESRVV